MTPDWLFIAPHFGDPWVMQFARNVTEVDDGLNRATFVTHTDQWLMPGCLTSARQPYEYNNDEPPRLIWRPP